MQMDAQDEVTTSKPWRRFVFFLDSHFSLLIIQHVRPPVANPRIGPLLGADRRPRKAQRNVRRAQRSKLKGQKVAPL